MDNIENDRTIGRTNVKAVGTTPPRQAHVSAPAGNDASTGVSVDNSPSSTSAPPSAALGSSILGAGGVINWPTSSEFYQLQNRIGQGAFASVWRAKIKTTNDNDSGPDDDRNEPKFGEGGEGFYCAIKIMDLEHVNINISGKFLFAV